MSGTTAEVLARAIHAAGCSYVFGLMGDGNMHLLIALEHCGVDVVEVRHESAAVAMAEGYGWSSGRVGICSVTHGPGLTHTSTSLVVAGRNRSPLVLIVAETPAGYGGAQCFDQRAFVAACEARYRRMLAGEDPAAVLDEVMALARERSGPVVLGVAADLLSAPATGAGKAPVPAAPAAPTSSDNQAAARRLLDALAEAQRPVLIAGRGALARRRTRQLAVAVAERVGAGLATTLPAKGLFDGHPLDLGISGGLAHPAAEKVLGSADLVVAVGTSMGRSTTQSNRLFQHARIVQVTTQITGDGTVVVPLRGDAERTLDELVRGLAELPIRAPWFTPVGRAADCWAQDLDDYAPEIPAGTVDPRHVLAQISEAIPRDAVVVVSNGHCSGFASAFLTAPSQGRFFAAQGFGSIGQAFPSAVGAAFGAPGRKVVCFEGDAGFMMHAQELDTAVRADADVTLVVLNDQALGTEFQRLREHGDDADLAIVQPPDLAGLGRAFGVKSWTIADDADVRRVAEAALRPGLAVVDVRIARSVLSRHMRLPHAHPTASTH